MDSVIAEEKLIKDDKDQSPGDQKNIMIVWRPYGPNLFLSRRVGRFYLQMSRN
jgi:hypothetical protein